MTDKILKAIKISSGVAAVLSVFWFFSTPGYEPAITFFVSLAALIGLFVKKQFSPKTSVHFSASNNLAQPNDAKALIAAMDSAYISDRLDVLRGFLPSLRPVSPDELSALLDILYISDRPAALRMLRNIIVKPVNAQKMKELLEKIYISERVKVSRYLL